MGGKKGPQRNLKRLNNYAHLYFVPDSLLKVHARIMEINKRDFDVPENSFGKMMSDEVMLISYH